MTQPSSQLNQEDKKKKKTGQLAGINTVSKAKELTEEALRSLVKKDFEDITVAGVMREVVQRKMEVDERDRQNYIVSACK